MKAKQVVMMCVMLVAGQQAFSQAEVAIGIKAGPNFATIDTKSSAGTNYKNRAGFHGGAFVLLKAVKFGIQPEVIFSQQGSKVRINNQDFDSNFTYMNIPVILKLYTLGGINIQAGPQFGFITKAEMPLRDVNNNYSVQDIKDEMRSSEVTLGLGLGWDAPFGLTFDARYNLGLSNVYDDKQLSGEAKNQVFQFSLGYKLIRLGN